MPVYSPLTILIFCTDKLIKYFIDKTDPDGFLEKYSRFAWPFCVRPLLPLTPRTVVNHMGETRMTRSNGATWGLQAYQSLS